MSRFLLKDLKTFVNVKFPENFIRERFEKVFRLFLRILPVKNELLTFC